MTVDQLKETAQARWAMYHTFRDSIPYHRTRKDEMKLSELYREANRASYMAESAEFWAKVAA